MRENNPEIAVRKETGGFKATLKSMDTEETFDLIFYRRIGYAWALLAKKLGVTPNAITVAGIILGVAAGVCFFFNDIWVNLVGAFLLVLADSFDSADGQLARMTRQYSRLGRILDGMCGDIWFIAIYFFICLRENFTPGFFMSYPWTIWVLAAVTGAFHAIQAAMADYYRQFHLFFLKGQDASELERASLLKESFSELSWKKDFLRKIMLWFYVNYTVGQEKRTPCMQKLRDALRERFGNSIPQSFRIEFRTLSKPLMKYTNILTFNTRCFALFAAILIFRMPWLYFVFELTVLNIVLVYMMWRHESICKKLYNQLETGDYDRQE